VNNASKKQNSQKGDITTITLKTFIHQIMAKANKMGENLTKS